MIYNKLALKLLTRTQRLSRSGFTLIEVLISVIVSGLIVTGLLYIVVEALQLDRREVVLNQVQGDMRRAIDYISTDLKEAVYVYPPVTPDSSIPGSDTVLLGTTGLDDVPEDAELILALWRLEPIDPDIALPNCDNFTGAQLDECRVLRIRQAYYNLVVYFQVPNQSGSIWQGGSRIIRYSLPRYTRSNITSLTRTSGFSDPTADGITFETWQRQEGESTQGITAVLVDGIAPIVPGTPGNFCRDETGAPNVNTYLGSQVDATSSFIACVRDVSTASGGSRSNQDVFLSLVGDAVTGRELVNPLSEDSRFPPIQARVLVRGVLEKPAPIQ